MRSLFNVLYAAPGLLARFSYWKFLMLIVSSGGMNVYQQLKGHDFEY